VAPSKTRSTAKSANLKGAKGIALNWRIDCSRVASRATKAAPAAQHYNERRAKGMAWSFANFDLSRVAFIAE
jgi:hypothetical protein